MKGLAKVHRLQWWVEGRRSAGYSYDDKHLTSAYIFLYFADRASQYNYLNIDQLDALNFLMSLLNSSLYMFRAHVLIVSRPKLYYTASGIVTLLHGIWKE